MDRALDRAAHVAVHDNNGYLLEVAGREVANGDDALSLRIEGLRAKRVGVEPEITIGHSVEQQERYVSADRAADKPATRRSIMDSRPDTLALFEELYEDVSRTAANVPIGSLHRHAEGRLQQSYAVLALIEQARDSKIIPDGGEFVATGARVQDKSTSRDYPAAHRLPCDLAIKNGGETVRLTDYFAEGLDRTWIDRNVFAPTDRMHRLANVADKWCEDAGMKKTLVDAANAVSNRRMTANQAMEEIVQPGYAAAVEKAREKVERNFSFLERQALANRIVDMNGKPFQKVPEPMMLKVKEMSARAAAKDVVERTLKAYGEVTELSPSQRMKSGMAVIGIVDNEKRAAAERKSGERRLSPGLAKVEVELATREAREKLDREMTAVRALAGKAQEAANAANDISRPMSSRMRAMSDAGEYGERMKTAWSALQREKGPQIVGDMEDRLRICGGSGQVQLAELKSSLAAPPRVVTDVARNIEEVRDQLLRNDRDRLEQDRRLREDRDNVVNFSPRLGPGM